MSPVIIFQLNTFKAPAVDLLRMNTLKGTKTAFLTPKRYDEHPRPFYTGAPPPGGIFTGVSIVMPYDSSV